MNLLDALSEILPRERIKARPLDVVAYSSDASFYRLIPQVVVQPASVDEVRALFGVSHRLGIPLTFRAAGTSLSGQAITDGILVDLSRHWRKFSVEDAGARVRVQPGVIGAAVNHALRKHGTRLGPDPASINTCMMGGILANNSSGMCCGVANNAYHTLDAMTFLLPDGTLVGDAFPAALSDGLQALRARVLADAALVARIREKYRIKNTSGYSLNALIDYEDPREMLAHLMIGSEGTLGFICEAVLRTVPDPPLRHTALLFFPAIRAACESLAALNAAGASALELMDRASLRAVQDQAGVPAVVRTLPVDAAGLLVEFQCSDAPALDEVQRAASEVFDRLALLEPPLVARDEVEQAALWLVRKGLFPSVGAARPQGTTVIIEDVAVAVDRLADTVADLQTLFVEHGYAEGIIFGHARDGNIHFVVTQSFNEPSEILRYERFMADLIDVVVGKYDGAIKAEHGTGRNMAPFVAREWGDAAYAVMQDLKRLIDPTGLLNPGVILNENPRAHVTDLKSLPVVEPEVDRCIECGFCEPKCPSRDLTTTPRQRIVLRREMARRADASDLWRDYVYDGLETCAADGMCATACPVGIDTGTLVKRLRAHVPEPKAAAWALRWFGALEAGARLSLRLGHVAESLVGADLMNALINLAEGVTRTRLPHWIAPIPVSAHGRLPRPVPGVAAAVYFPSCVARTCGDVDTLPLLARRAGLGLAVVAARRGHCCGMPFSSKGYPAAHAVMVNRTFDILWQASERGALPVVTDNSSCAYALRTSRDALSESNRLRFDQLQIQDPVAFAHDVLLPRLQPVRVDGTAAVHPVCSLVKQGLTPKLLSLARACATDVKVPFSASCCGAAGDRGFLFPELTAAATRAEAAEVRSCDFGVASNITCENVMTRATGLPYQSALSLLAAATRPLQ